MTCIVGLIENGTCWMGADRQTTDTSGWKGWLAHPKVRRTAQGILLGTSGDHCLQNLCDLLADKTEDLIDLNSPYLSIIRSLLPTILDSLKGIGVMDTDGGREIIPGSFLIGTTKALYLLDSYCGVRQCSMSYMATGAGRTEAMAVMYATQELTLLPELSPEQRITIALKAAAEHDRETGGPFDIISTEKI